MTTKGVIRPTKDFQGSDFRTTGHTQPKENHIFSPLLKPYLKRTKHKQKKNIWL